MRCWLIPPMISTTSLRTATTKGIKKMNITYEIDDFFGIATEDNFENGEIGKGQLKDYKIVLSASTIEGLLVKVAQEFDTAPEHLLLDSCDEDGRIDIQVHETAEGWIVNQVDPLYKKWVKGQARLWSVTYSGTLRKVETGLSFAAEMPATVGQVFTGGEAKS